VKTELVLALRRQIRNLREMIAVAEADPRRSRKYVEQLKKKLRSAEKRLFK
jgi:hypothetical protein